MTDYERLLKVAEDNYKHVVFPGEPCKDPDCELHNPGVIEDEASRLNAMAWYLAGAQRAADEMYSHITDMDADDRWGFVGGDSYP